MAEQSLKDKTGNKRTIIINWGVLGHFGGIENRIYSVMKFMSSNGVRVIWLKLDGHVTGEAFETLVNENNIEIVPVSNNHLFWFRHGRIEFDRREEIVIVSYTVFDALHAFTLKNEFPDNNITCIYSVPDTTGNFYFIERYFTGWLNRIVFKKIRKTLDYWNKANLIVFCAPLQVAAFEKNYSLIVDNPQTKLEPAIFPPPQLNKELLTEKSKREGSFNIITVGRFDFPHKGYMLGLIRSFASLKKKYPQLSLTIIGQGKDKNVLVEEISKVGQEIAKDIYLLGEISSDRLPEYYRDAHLSVAVAGSTYDAARNGVLSLVARNHYSDACEVYGFMPEAKELTVATTKGIPVESYIEKAILMSREEYVKQCVSAHHMFDEIVNPWCYFDFAHTANEFF